MIGDTGDIDTGIDYHGMAKLTGPRARVRMKFASGTELQLNMDGDRGPGLGAIFVCEKGKIEINRNKLASNPKELVRSSDNPGSEQAAGNGLSHRELDRVHQEPVDAAMPTSKSASARPHSATWSTSCATSARSAKCSTGIRSPNGSRTATRPTRCCRVRVAKGTSCPTLT